VWHSFAPSERGLPFPGDKGTLMKRHPGSYFFILTLVILLGTASRLSAQTVMWDANSEPDVAGYILYYGSSSGAYSNQVDVGNRTSYNLNIDWSRNWFFAVQAYSTAGATSPLSVEAQWTPVATPPQGTRLTSLDASAAGPYQVGQPVTWTASGTSSKGPLEYRFWMSSAGSWKMMQDFSASSAFTWVPTWSDQGPHLLQVWARTVGSTAQYEAFLGTPQFDVMSSPMEISADLDFPTPPNNPVTWTAKVAGSTSTALEYKFWVQDLRTGVWSVMRDYNPSPQAVWVPTTPGQYGVQAWARRPGTSAPYDTWAGTNLIEIKSSPLQVTRLDADTDFPLQTGTTVTWTARVKGGTAGPLQYQFWLFSNNRWTLGQAWSSAKTFTWRPTWSDAGAHAVQVWARNAGSTADYDAWKGTPLFQVQSAALHMTADKQFPLAPGTTVRWTAQVPDTTVGFQYQFWIYGQSNGQWTMAQPYSVANTFDWTPSVGTYAIQAWAKRNGSTAAYDAWRSSDWLKVGLLPVKVHSLLPNKTLPASVNTTITWTALASGGTSGPLQYQFLRYDTATGWTTAQAWGPLNTYTWTPSSTDAGPHALQVWVRSAGSTAQYEAYGATGYFTIIP
jgi:hypothetical protein